METFHSLYLQGMKLSGTRYRLMAALMISSQLLLTAFVAYWLFGQFREEKMLLYGQLKKEYSQVHEQLLDSMLMKHLVIPSLDDSVMVRIHVGESSDGPEWFDADSIVQRFPPHQQGQVNKITIDALRLDGSLPSDTGVQSFDVTSVISDQERMVRSVKLFIHKTQEVFHGDTGVFFYAMNLDSSSLLLSTEKAFQERNWPFGLDWPTEDLSKEDPSKEELAEMHEIILGGGITNDLPALQVFRTGPYLFRSMLPQFLFGLILLLLSASALLFAYRSLQKQVALNRLRNDFIGNISHELKTPVSTVKVALEALSKHDHQRDPRKMNEYLEMASSELGRLELLVGKVLHHEMMNNPSLVLEKQDCHLADLARKGVRSLEIPIRETGASITVSEDGGPCTVRVDKVYLEGVIINLIDNSLKYAGENPEISLHIACTPAAATLSVSDNGPGIPDEYKEQVFEKFFRIPSGNTHNVKGYGLGLNFAAQVMGQHGGSISFTNLPEGGCRFTLQFPRTEA
jgi:signal transduction histidine kinase